jgi:hypothetical protein
VVVSFDDPSISTYVEGFDRVLGFLGEPQNFHDARVDEVTIRRSRGSGAGEGQYLDLKLTIYRNASYGSGVALQLRFWDLTEVSIVLPDQLCDLLSMTVEDLLEVSPRFQPAGLGRLRVTLTFNALPGLKYEFTFTCALISVISVGEMRISDLARFKPAGS